ncbi:MAG: LysM peptidoglycan-binding domain-containing protein [Lentisphaerae bacterium]|nr:LysM peptidoglycan-binding domain-containing protein [Lentisphaerota bacterium]
MKTSWVVSAVVVAHCVVVAGILCVQGCGTTTAPTTSSRPPEPVMPGEVAQPVVATPAPSPMPTMPVAQPPVKTWPSETTPYTVQKGDSISLIAARFHVSKAELMGLNRISNPNKIVVGQELKLPGKVDLSAPVPHKKPKPAPVAKKASTPKASTAAAPGGEGDYVVKSGDILSRIAVRNGTTVAALKDANGLKSDRLSVGQKLKIPGGKKASASEPAATVSEPVATPEAAPAPVEVAPAPAATPTGEGDADVAPSADVPALPGMDAAGTAAAPVASAAPTTFRTHKVEQGEDLYHVSLMWDVKVEELQRINGLTGTTLTPGQELKIPVPQ